jgi:hypothetical protein
MLNRDWRRTRLRLLRQVRQECDVAQARTELETILQQARIDASVEIPVSAAPFGEVLHRYSADAELLVLGLNRVAEEAQEDFHSATQALLEGMPSTLLVHSSGEADLLA